MSDDPRIRTLGHDSLAVSQENLHSVDKSTVSHSQERTENGTGVAGGTLQNESQESEMQGNPLEAVITEPYHLPECPCSQQPEPSNHWHDQGAACEGCICDELRACEQRVLGMRLDGLNVKSFNAALDAAEQAILELHYPLQNVTTLQWCSECSGLDGDEIEWPCRTVEQIRSLKEKP